MEPFTALSSCEGALRQLLSHVLSSKHGADWLEKVFKADKIVSLNQRRDEETAKRTSRGVAILSTSLLDYTHFYELVDLAEQNWNEVADALGKKAVTAPLLKRFDDLRNTVAHSRSLLPFEEDLIAGIAGEIRNRVTLYMSTQAPSGEYFARIEEVVDNFGNRIDGAQTTQTSNPMIMCGQVLRVGDVLTFRCRGWDPQGRDLKWSMGALPAAAFGFNYTVGNDVEVQWEVKGDNVSTRSAFMVRMQSDGEFHRWPEGLDGLALFSYTVLPPLPLP